MNLRVDVLESAAGVLSQNKPPSVLEIGCMFSEQEGLSTLILGRYVAANGGRLLSIDADEQHLAKARELITAHQPELLNSIEFIHGYSINVLPRVLESTELLDLVFIDGGAQPEVCLEEFELVAERLNPNGLIIVDDVQSMEPTTAFDSSRQYGKGTLIYPLLIIGEYLRYRQSKIQDEPNAASRPTFPKSRSVRSIQGTELANLFSGFHYRKLSQGNHGMLVVGTEAMVEKHLQHWNTHN